MLQLYDKSEEPTLKGPCTWASTIHLRNTCGPSRPLMLCSHSQRLSHLLVPSCRAALESVGSGGGTTSLVRVRTCNLDPGCIVATWPVSPASRSSGSSSTEEWCRRASKGSLRRHPRSYRAPDQASPRKSLHPVRSPCAAHPGGRHGDAGKGGCGGAGWPPESPPARGRLKHGRYRAGGQFPTAIRAAGDVPRPAVERLAGLRRRAKLSSLAARPGCPVRRAEAAPGAARRSAEKRACSTSIASS